MNNSMLIIALCLLQCTNVVARGRLSSSHASEESDILAFTDDDDDGAEAADIPELPAVDETATDPLFLAGIQAVQSGNIEQFVEWHNNGGSAVVTSTDPYDRTLLHFATTREMVMTLYNLGISPLTPDSAGHIALHYASLREDLGAIAGLLQFDGRLQINAANRDGRHPVFYLPAAANALLRARLNPTMATEVSLVRPVSRHHGHRPHEAYVESTLAPLHAALPSRSSLEIGEEEDGEASSSDSGKLDWGDKAVIAALAYVLIQSS